MKEPVESIEIKNNIKQHLKAKTIDANGSNDNSVAIKITNGNNSIVLTGDAEHSSEADMCNSGIDLNCDILVLGHHGSATVTSWDFLQETVPEGMISKLSKEFARKTEHERKSAYADMLLAPVMHTDCTNAKKNGESCYVYVCALPDGKALYFAREKKGHEGVKGTVSEDYQGILVHDHDITFYNYGTNHQECLAHVLRYLKDSISNEPDRVWNKEMHLLIQDMIHYRNKAVSSGKSPDSHKVSEFQKKYLEILEIAEREYENIPASEYYREGYNLSRRMKKYMQNHLLFLHDFRVPATNNEAERLLRNYKRKQTQAVIFRSFESIDYLCQCMSMLVLMRLEEPNNIFERVSRIFG